MRNIEFETYIDAKGNIIIPKDIQSRIKEGDIANIIITSIKNNKKDNNIDNVKKIWENYNIEGLWNGE